MKFALTLALSPRRGNREFQRWEHSLDVEFRQALENVFPLLGERARVRANKKIDCIVTA